MYLEFETNVKLPLYVEMFAAYSTGVMPTNDENSFMFESECRAFWYDEGLNLSCMKRYWPREKFDIPTPDAMKHYTLYTDYLGHEDNDESKHYWSVEERKMKIYLKKQLNDEYEELIMRRARNFFGPGRMTKMYKVMCTRLLSVKLFDDDGNFEKDLMNDRKIESFEKLIPVEYVRIGNQEYPKHVLGTAVNQLKAERMLTTEPYNAMINLNIINRKSRIIDHDLFKAIEKIV